MRTPLPFRRQPGPAPVRPADLDTMCSAGHGPTPKPTAPYPAPCRRVGASGYWGDAFGDRPCQRRDVCCEVEVVPGEVLQLEAGPGVLLPGRRLVRAHQ